MSLEFDAQGTEDLKDGTGNPQHPKIAVVIANKLLYVVDNDAKIETGRMQILLEGYSDQQLNRIKESIQA